MSLSKPEKKRKVDFECRVFKAEWSVNYFVTELDDKALCLLCNDTIAVLRVQYLASLRVKASKQYSQLNGKQRSEKLETLKRNISSQCNCLTKMKMRL